MNTIFKPGDKVRVVGFGDRIFELQSNFGMMERYYPLKIIISTSSHDCLITEDGKQHEEQEEPTIFLVERPKKKKKIKGWMAISPMVFQDKPMTAVTMSEVFREKKEVLLKHSNPKLSYQTIEIEFEVDDD